MEEDGPPMRFDGTYVYESTDWTTIENVFRNLPFEIRGAGRNHSRGVSVTLANNIILLSKEPKQKSLHELVWGSVNKKIDFVTE